MAMRIAQVAVLVREYDEAIGFYRDALGFEVSEDTNLGGGKRWVRLGPPGGECGAEILLSRAVTEEQRAQVGRQAGGRVMVFIETDNLTREHARMSARGVVFTEPPREAPYGRVAVFVDLYGNRIDLIEPRS